MQQSGPGWFKKQPSENYIIRFEFDGKLPLATSLASGAVAAYRLETTPVLDNTVLASQVAIISGTQAHARVQAGTVGKSYKITLLATLNDSSILEEDVRMDVIEL